LDPDLASFNGWYPSSEAMDSHPRIVIPCTNSFGVSYWQARLIDHAVADLEKLNLQDIPPKRYQSTPAARVASIVVTWPYEEAKRVTLVEGPMDALAASEVGSVGIGLMGNSPPPECLEYATRILRSYGEWWVVPDNDDRKLGCEIVAALGMLGVRSSLIMLPSRYKDLAAVPRDLRRGLLA